MAFTNSEYLELLRTLFLESNNVDTSLHDFLGTFFEPEGKPFVNLERCLIAMIQIVRSETSQGYSYVLTSLQDSIQVENDNAIEDVVVDLTHQEQEIYNMSDFSLSDLPDLNECLIYLTLALDGIRD